ncbi:maleylpyruvate isomerase family mycothiol-dependent enzyme [Nocardia thailandica]|uniref:maleylpyruvate isomerase family mycothiol-dependent enzyme n=1 Tax=Nocardia thailandica TaxID=257275 RepID=UPI0002FEB294|nr:maleylpyruvate isomerase family mycothiol-dependent enzyme [Nocardia thailandica]
MNTEELWPTIADQRRAVADLLGGLTAEQLDAPSLCAGWRVRDVAAHIALAPQSPGPLGMLREAVRARGSFHRLNHDIAVRYADATPDLAAVLRAVAESRRLPAVTNARNIHYDVIVHAQDIARPLGATVEVDSAAAAIAAARVWEMGWPFWARRRFRDVRLVATDSSWSAGAGTELRGTTLDLLMLLTGRSVPALRKSVPGSAVE